MSVKTVNDGPKTIGPFEVLARIAEGSRGAVYKARDPRTGATVAIKVAADELTRDKVLLQRFEQEFRAASNIRHPNLVRGLDFGWEGPRPYLVMEFVEGDDLWTRIESAGRLPEAEAVGYVTQAARGLHEAHKHGIIHRDVKPDNILLTTGGQAKLADLGLSKDLESDTELTRPNGGLGTPNFIAPEQFSDAKHAGVRCDIYSLGATLYMALTGRLPFEGRAIGLILKKKLADDLPAPRALVPALSERVDWAVRRALLADPERRYGTCPEFIAALTGEGGSAEGKRSGSARRSGNREKRPSQERRASVRYDCALPTSCSVNLSVHEDEDGWQGDWEAQVSNLSTTGIGLLLSRRFEPGSILAVEVAGPSGEAKRTVKMRVVQVERAAEGRWYLGGKLVEKLDKEEVRRLL